MRTAALLLALLAAPALAQAPKKGPLGEVKGYEWRRVAEFDVYVNKDVFAADTSMFERKPMDVLELELKAAVSVMSKKAAAVLQRLVIWVEWDDTKALTNGRPGAAVAVYYGGHQAGLNPARVKTITVLRMKSLTAEHQPKTDSGRCVLLHELAHAVHDRDLGVDHPGIKAAYAQAMDRKLYDKTQYAFTNESEFFAELTCAYFNQLHYYPNTRADLKWHDKFTHDTLDKIWKGASLPNRKPPSDPPADLSVKRADVVLGTVVHGPKVTADDLDKQVVAFVFWGGDETVVLSRMAGLHDELAPFGLKLVAGPGYRMQDGEVEAEVKGRAVPFTAVDRLLVPVEAEGVRRSQEPPHALLFAPDGSCVFRGRAYDLLPKARAEVGRAVLDRLGLKDPPKSLADVAKALTSGERLVAVIPKLIPLKAAKDTDTAAAAKNLYDVLAAPGEDALKKAAGLTKADPVEAYILAERVAAVYAGTPLKERADTAVRNVQRLDPVQDELQARVQLGKVEKLEGVLRGRPGGFDPADTGFRIQNATTFAELKKLIELMKKKYPAARATGQAMQIGKGYGVE
jgi:hypothetical protein